VSDLDAALFTDVGAMLTALDNARVADFVRFVQRRLREERAADFAELPFKDGWLIALGSYAEKAARNV
jgi:hypothetical protein